MARSSQLMPVDLSPGREPDPEPVSREVEPSRTANVVDAQEVVVEFLDYALHVGAVGSELVYVCDGEDRQGLGSVVPLDRGLQRVRGIEIAVVGDEDELFVLADVPDLQVGRGRRQPDVLKAIECKAEGLPE